MLSVAAVCSDGIDRMYACGDGVSQGRVRTNLIKKAAKHVIEKYFARYVLV